jgi:CheY-like chemotaxis protein
MNYDVIRVSNGLEAVEEFDGSSCDAVLMDILMPEMDGFEATRMIREKERLVGSSHTPIIALTSYSLKAIHEKCVSVGMDSYLHKPVSAQDIKKLFSSAIVAGPVTAAGLDDRLIEQLPLLDVQETLDNLGNNADLYREIMELFTANIPADHRALLTAINNDILLDVVHHAHTIKGMSSNVGAKRYAELTRQLQDAALNGDIGEASQWLHRLSVELLRLQAAITEVDWQKLH